MSRYIRIILSILALSLLLCGLAHAETIASGSCGESVQWTLDDAGTLTISGTGDMQVSDNTWSNSTESIKSVVIEPGVTSIGDSAFYGCSNITSVSIPDGVKSIGDSAFLACTSLTEITVPSGVDSIGAQAFLNCTSLSTITIPGDLVSFGAFAFQGISSDYVFYCNAGTTGARAISGNGHTFIDPDHPEFRLYQDGFTEDANYTLRIVQYLGTASDLVIPSTLKSIPVTEVRSSVFRDNTVLKSVVLQENITLIYPYAFSGCTALESISLPASLNGISTEAFAGCSSLESIVIPENVTSIGDYAFLNCSSLSDVTLPDGITTLGCNVFSGRASDCIIRCKVGSPTSSLLNTLGNYYDFTDPAYPEYTLSQTTLEDGSYQLAITSYIGNSTDVSIPAKINSVPVTAINNQAFRGCSILYRISLPVGLTTIGSEAFYGCTNLNRVSIYGDISSIGELAFYGCSSLTDVSFTSNAASIDSSAFSNCTSLTDVSIYGSLTSIGHSAFNNCTALKSVILPNTASIGSYAFYNCKSLTSIALPQGIQAIEERTFKYCTSLVSITIPEGVTSIGLRAFSMCENLANVNLPDTLTTIGEGVFYCCTSLEKIDIPNSVTTIEQDAFTSCASLKRIVIPEKVTEIPYYCFGGCSKLERVYIPEGVETIGRQAFYSCKNLQRITIPSTVTTIESEAFLDSGIQHAAFMNPMVATLDPKMFYYNLPTIYCYEYSDAEYWAIQNSCSIVYLDDFHEDTPLMVFLPESYRLETGVDFQTDYEVFPMMKYPLMIWTSTDDEIISVSDDGELYVHGEGEVTITATASYGDAVDSMTVTSYIGAESFDLSDSELWVVSKESVQLSIENLEPANTSALLNWSSSDSSIVSVDENGLVTPMRIGSATITASYENGVKRSCVIHSCYPVTAIEFVPMEDELIPCTRIMLTANVTARTQSFVNKLVVFESDQPEIASVDKDGVVTAHMPGSVTITATATNGVSADCSVTVQQMDVLRLPGSLTWVSEEAFLNAPTEMVILPQGCEGIDSNAFAGNANLKYVYLPDSVTEIAVDAFEGCKGFSFICDSENASTAYAKDYNIPVIINPY